METATLISSKSTYYYSESVALDVLDVTIVIPVKNEERNLATCIEAIGKNFVAEIVVVDSGSTDNTRKIALDAGIPVVDFKWNGEFPKKRNWLLRNYTLHTKWVMFLDADEILTDEFKTELRKKLTKEDKAGYWLNYSVYFLGKKLKGGYPMRKLALFQVGLGEYEYIEEQRWSDLDMEVHEHPIIKGEIGVIHSKIDHRDYNGISRYAKKHNEYASWEAARFLKAINNTEIAAKWTWKQRIKYRLLQSPLVGPVYFFGSYFFMGGFRDGARGLAFALLKLAYFTQIYCRIKEKTQA